MSDVEERAIYVDFKGLRDAAPVVVGMVCEDAFEQVVTDPAFGDAALARDVRVNNFDDEIEAMVARCRREARMVVGFSRQPVEAAMRFSSHGPAFDQCFEDARDLAQLWHEKSGRPGTSGWTLADFLADLGYPLPRALGPKHTGSRLRYVRQALQRHGGFDAISGGAKAKWTKLLQQSTSDTRALRQLALAATQGLDS